MAVTITTNTLSPRVRYLNVSPSTVNADAKDVVLAVANALIDLGWSRHDTAGLTAIVGTNDNAGVILRRQCYDFAQSGHFNYLAIRITGTTNNTYAFRLTQAADWSSTTNIASFVNAARHEYQYNPNDTGDLLQLSFTQGGTIWLFDSGRTLVITTAGALAQPNTDGNLIIVGEYKKEFGENTNAATGYIHNGVLTTNRWLMAGNGTGTWGANFPAGNTPAMVSWVSPNTANNVTIPWTMDNFVAAANYGLRWLPIVSLANWSQFLLTEAPTTTLNTNTFSSQTAAPATCSNGFATRILCGLYGYIGHISTGMAMSILQFYTGQTHRSSVGGITTNSGSGGIPSNPLFAAHSRPNTYPLGSYNKEFTYDSVPGNLRFSMIEPLLSCGTTNGNPQLFTTPVNYKFSILGRIFGLKIFGPYDTNKYSFLDSITIPCDAEGYYQEDGTNREFWFIPHEGNNISFLMPK